MYTLGNILLYDEYSALRRLQGTESLPSCFEEAPLLLSRIAIFSWTLAGEIAPAKVCLCAQFGAKGSSHSPEAPQEKAKELKEVGAAVVLNAWESVSDAWEYLTDGPSILKKWVQQLY